MNNGLIMPIEISIRDKKTLLQGQIARTAIWANSIVVQVRTADDEDYYLVYFRNSMIFGDKLDDVKEGTFIDRAFREGIIFESEHPFCSDLCPKQTVTIPNRSKLFQLLQTRFTPQEIAYIATTLDSFFEKETLVKVIEQIYFEHKRNGKFLKAFQILLILADFMPELKTAQERMSSMEFNSYHDIYHPANLPAILKKDPLYTELYCFKNRTNPKLYIFLEEILKANQSHVEMIALWLEKARRLKHVDKFETGTAIALKFLSMKKWILILATEKINPFKVLPEARTVIEKMMEEGKYEKTALYLLNFMDDLPAEYDSILSELWENVEVEFVETHLEHFISILQKKNSSENHKQAEAQIYQLIVSMLKGNDLKTVYEKLQPLQNALPHSLLFRKLSKMVRLLEDPDGMMELGDYYAEFKQYDPAIDCYSWEMELKPKDPDPVWRICKMYQQKGMQIEAAAYQKVFTQLKDIQESI